MNLKYIFLSAIILISFTANSQTHEFYYSPENNLSKKIKKRKISECRIIEHETINNKKLIISKSNIYFDNQGRPTIEEFIFINKDSTGDTTFHYFKYDSLSRIKEIEGFTPSENFKEKYLYTYDIKNSLSKYCYFFKDNKDLSYKAGNCFMFYTDSMNTKYLIDANNDTIETHFINGNIENIERRHGTDSENYYKKSVCIKSTSISPSIGVQSILERNKFGHPTKKEKKKIKGDLINSTEYIFENGLPSKEVYKDYFWNKTYISNYNYIK